jgi:hypothetical protein
VQEKKSTEKANIVYNNKNDSAALFMTTKSRQSAQKEIDIAFNIAYNLVDKNVT